MNSISKIITFISIVNCCSIPSSAGGVPLDGYNVFAYTDSTYLLDENLSMTKGDTNDPFYRIPEVAESQCRELSVSVLLGAETGDPLLNIFSSPRAYENRDHRTFGGIEYHSTRIPLSVAARYRYIDTYTDRFDAQWKKYTSITGTPMRFSNVGVSYEHFIGARWQGSPIQAEASVHPFSRWHATPYFFSPLFEDGFSGEGRVALQVNPIAISSQHRFVRSNWYYDHQTPERYNDYFMKNDLSICLNDRVTGMVSGTYSAVLTPSARVDLSLFCNSLRSNLGGTVTGFSNKQFAGDLFGSLRITNNWSCSLRVAHDYRPKSRSYHFMQNDRIVSYYPIAYHRNDFSATMFWHDTLGFPLKLSGWFFHCDRILRESIDDRGDTVVINQTVRGTSVGTFAGLNGRWTMMGEHFSISLRPGFIVPFGKRKDIGFFIGKMAECEATWRSSDLNPARASITIAGNDRPSLTYLIVQNETNGYTRSTFYAPANVSLFLSCRVPFIFMPVHSIVKETAFCISGGPIRLIEKDRYPFHPGGNDFGPEMYVGFEGRLK